MSLSGFPSSVAAVLAEVCTRLIFVIFLVGSDSGALRSTTDHPLVVAPDRRVIVWECGFSPTKPSTADTLFRVVVYAFHVTQLPTILHRLEVRCQQ